MQKLSNFFLICSGADRDLLQGYPSEKIKYTGVGSTIFFTAVFAFLAASYALFTVFDSVIVSCVIGFLWGLLIFNLDRYIVSSMRKSNRTKEVLSALPRLAIAIMISIVIAKPLELKIFEKEIGAELIIMEQELRTRQEEEVRKRFMPMIAQYQTERQAVLDEIALKTKHRDLLVAQAQQEADGTGGSKQKNLGPIYKIKKQDAERAEKERAEYISKSAPNLQQLEKSLQTQDSLLNQSLRAIGLSEVNGLAARLEALNRMIDRNGAIALANLFIVILFILIEISPVLVKLISAEGPYDHLLNTREHQTMCDSITEIAKQRTEVRTQAESLHTLDKDWIEKQLRRSTP